ncbi:MAG TPA: glycosyltransferase family 2 protein [Armatimonadota bacterium]|nr:glycosyltransferase family 2 protein [Armatimonadota bacterium]
MHSGPSKDLSIAIASWNTRDLLDRCLESVYAASAGLAFETIVVDNASDDGSAEMVASKYPDVKLIQNKLNLGFAAACNLAFKHSVGRYFLLLNSDTVVLDGALRAMVGFMHSHPDAGAAGCRLLNPDGSLQRSCSRFPSLMTEFFDALYLSKLFPTSRLFGSYSMSYWDFDEVREVDFAGGSCLIVRREAVEEVGLLDESFFMYVEEADWCYRMWENGWKVYYFPDARVIHLGGESARRYGGDILLHLYVSRNKFIRKHRGRTAAVAHRMIVGLGAVSRLCFFGIRRLRRHELAEAVCFQWRLLKWTVTAPSEAISQPAQEVNDDSRP